MTRKDALEFLTTWYGEALARPVLRHFEMTMDEPGCPIYTCLTCAEQFESDTLPTELLAHVGSRHA